MKRRRIGLSIALGSVLAFGLLLGLNPGRSAVEAASSRSTEDHIGAIADALTYLQTRQLPNGAVESDWDPGTSDDFATIKTALALAATGRPMSYLASADGNTSLDYLETRAYTYTRDLTGTLFPGRAGMIIAAAVAGDRTPHAFGQYPPTHSAAGEPIDLVAELKMAYHPATGAFSTPAKSGLTTGGANTVNQLWAIIGAAAAQETVPVTATNFFISLRESDGGWAWVTGSGGDVDMTGLAVQALLASGNIQPTDDTIQEALSFLRETQLDSGGWAGYNGDLSVDSTASAIQSIGAAGYTPATVSWATDAGHTPYDDLIALQSSNGSFGDNALGTAHAIAGLAEAPLPILGRAQRANRALTWVREQQNADGSWDGWAGPDPGATCDAVLAYASAGIDPHSVTAVGTSISAMDYLSTAASAFVTKSVDSAGKLALAVEAAEGDAHHFGGVDVVDAITSTGYDPSVGAFGVPTNTWHQSWAMLGLRAAGETIPLSATQALIELQRSNGGWKYDLTDARWNTTSPDSTGLALQALVAASVPVTHSSVVSGVTYLRDQQDVEGGWGNANATSYAMQGLLACGEDLTTEWSTEGGHNPYSALAAYQKPDGPFVDTWDSPWGLPEDNVLATSQAVPALLGAHYPVRKALEPMDGVYRGPDPDRTVASDPKVSWDNSVHVLIPFDSDLNENGSVTLTWREVGTSSWATGTVHRANGYYSTTLSLAPHGNYELQTTFADPDGVQYRTAMSNTVSLITTLARYDLFLPLVLRQ